MLDREGWERMRRDDIRIEGETLFTNTIPGCSSEFAPALQQAGARYTWDGEVSYGMLERSMPVDQLERRGARSLQKRRALSSLHTSTSSHAVSCATSSRASFGRRAGSFSRHARITRSSFAGMPRRRSLGVNRSSPGNQWSTSSCGLL